MATTNTLYSVYTAYNDGTPDVTDHFLNPDERLASLRTRALALDLISSDDVYNADEKTCVAVLQDVVSVTGGTVTLRETAIDTLISEQEEKLELPLGATGTLQQLFVLDTEDYRTYTSLYQDTDELTNALIDKVLETHDPLFPAEVRDQVAAVLTRGRIEILDSRPRALLAEIREVIEDSHFAVFINEVAFPTN